MPALSPSSVLALTAALALSACAATQARLHTQTELNDVGRNCGLALGELFQDESEKRLVFLFKPGATVEQRACVVSWAKRNGLKTVYVDAIAFPES